MFVRLEVSEKWCNWLPRQHMQLARVQKVIHRVSFENNRPCSLKRCNMLMFVPLKEALMWAENVFGVVRIMILNWKATEISFQFQSLKSINGLLLVYFILYPHACPKETIRCSFSSRFSHRVHEDDQLTGAGGNSDSAADVGFLFFSRFPSLICLERGFTR